MNRRSFFAKALGVAAAMVAGPGVVKAAPSPPKPSNVIHSSQDELHIGGMFSVTKGMKRSIQDVMKEHLPRGMKWINWHVVESLGENPVCKWEATAWSISKWEAVKRAVDAQRGLRWNRRGIDVSENLSPTP